MRRVLPKVPATMISITLIGILMLGGIFHTSLPHNHSSNPLVTDTIHAAAHLSSKELYAVAVESGVWVVTLLLAVVSVSRVKHYMLAKNPEMEFLRRGIALYRRFR